jgi:hypothetical protein
MQRIAFAIIVELDRAVVGHVPAARADPGGVLEGEDEAVGEVAAWKPRFEDGRAIITDRLEPR